MLRRYSIEGTIAEGAQGRIFHAVDNLTGEQCVLKVGESIRREALLLRLLNHPFTQIPFDCGELPELGAYAAFPALSQKPIFEHLRADPDSLQNIARWIAEFLACLHHRGWLYNDFKPEHFLISEGELKVLDFGLCTPISESSTSFSGTFPYISPERLSGRPVDERSDLFALGMLLLQAFYPDEDWAAEPSLSALQQLQVKSKKLPRFWRDLLSQLTALEPSQRIGSAEELWKKLLPRFARSSILLFPLESPYRLPPDDLDGQGVFIYESPSSITLSSVQNQFLMDAWEKGQPVFDLDLGKSSVQAFCKSLSGLLTNKPAQEFFTAVNSLQAESALQGRVIIVRVPVEIASSELSYLCYMLSTLSATCRRFVILSVRPLKEVAEESWKYSVIPAMSALDRQQLLATSVPPAGHRDGASVLKNKKFAYPEHLVVELQRLQPPESLTYWPVPARKVYHAIPYEQLTVFEKRVLGFLAVAGGSLTAEVICSVDAGSVQNISLLLERLSWKGFVRHEKEEYVVTFPLSEVYRRLRKEQMREMAGQLLPLLSNDPERYYHTALAARKQRSAACAALRLARAESRSGQLDSSIEWYWRAYRCGALLPRSILIRLTRYYLLRAKKSRTSRLLKQWRQQCGRSYRWVDQVLHYYHGSNKLEKAASLAKRTASRAHKRGKDRLHQYFSVRHAGFLVVSKRFDEAQVCLNSLRSSYDSLEPGAQGLLDHYEGLYEFFRGKFEDALRHTKVALRKPHAFRSTSLMNLGVIYGRLGRIEKAEKCLHKAIGIFMRQHNADRLCYAFNNMGLVQKQKGQLKAARDYHQRTIHLSRATDGASNLVLALNNVGITYSLEGRTRLAISYHRKAASIARMRSLTAFLAQSLSNMGFQYAILGRFRTSLQCLQKSAIIRKRLKMAAVLAASYEFLGLAYFFAKQYGKARDYLSLSRNLFKECAAVTDSQRSDLYLALISCKRGKLEDVKQVLDDCIPFQESTFEYGLYHYLNAAYSLLNGVPQEQCRTSLHEAERTFRRLPALLWLGAAHELKAEYLFRIDHCEKAALSLQSASNIYLRLGARKALFNLVKGGANMKIPTNILDRMIEKLPFKVLLMIRDVLEEKRPDRMISKILATAVEFTDMERAVLILKGEPPRIFQSASLDEDTIRDIREISFSAIDSTARSKEPFVCLNAVQDSALKNRASIIANQIMSIVCLPLWNEDQLIGYIYLDSREGVETLAKTESVLLEIFASIVAMSLSTSLILERSLEEIDGFRASLGLKQEFPEIVGCSKAMIDVLKMVHPLISHDLPVLITGETGTGKELIARVLHFCGKRKGGPFVAVNCSALNETLMESEIFGHEKGSFTGATEMRKGLFEQANNGTLFLDEIGEMPRSMQAKFLRVLQEGEFRRVGGNTNLRTNARIVLATNRNITEMLKDKEFREDFYYRIRGVQIHLPALRERQDDIPLLSAFFLKSTMVVARKKIRGYSPEVLSLFKVYPWPGNVRQLKIEIERIVAYIDHDWIQVPDLDPLIQEYALREDLAPESGVTLREMEKTLIVQRLEALRWNIFHTARSLGLTRNGLYSKMKQYSIPKKPPDSSAVI
jgi:Nif-specific regulatory protein